MTPPDDRNTTPPKRVKRWPFILIGVGLFVVWLATPWVLGKLYPNLAERGQFGDMFGAVNALFSGFALLSAIYAVVLQSRELELQRQELIDTRKEMAIQSQVFAEQLRLQQEEMRRTSDPIFMVTRVDGNNAVRIVFFANRGADISAVSGTIEPIEGCDSDAVSSIADGYRITIRRRHVQPTEPFPEVTLSMSYQDILNRDCTRRFRLAGDYKRFIPV